MSAAAYIGCFNCGAFYIGCLSADMCGKITFTPKHEMSAKLFVGSRKILPSTAVRNKTGKMEFVFAPSEHVSACASYSCIRASAYS